MLFLYATGWSLAATWKAPPTPTRCSASWAPSTTSGRRSSRAKYPCWLTSPQYTTPIAPPAWASSECGVWWGVVCAVRCVVCIEVCAVWCVQCGVQWGVQWSVCSEVWCMQWGVQWCILWSVQWCIQWISDVCSDVYSDVGVQ